MQTSIATRPLPADQRSRPGRTTIRQTSSTPADSGHPVAPERAWSHGRASEKLGSFHCRTIVFENSTATAAALTTALRAHDHEAVAVHAREDAIAKVVSFAPSAILIDLDGPDRGHDVGCALARDVRGLALTSQPILLACSSDQADEPRRGEARRAGFDYHLLKPVCADEVARIVRAGILRPRGVPC